MKDLIPKKTPPVPPTPFFWKQNMALWLKKAQLIKSSSALCIRAAEGGFSGEVNFDELLLLLLLVSYFGLNLPIWRLAGRRL